MHQLNSSTKGGGKVKKWQKFILSILLILYAIPLAEFVWPVEFYRVLQSINDFLAKIHVPKIPWLTVSFNTGIVLLGLLLIIWLVVLFAPIARLELILRSDKDGQLELSNKSIASYTELAVIKAGLFNPRVKVKSTRNHVKIAVRAATEGNQLLKPQLTAVTDRLNHQITNFIGDDAFKVHTKILIDQQQKHEKTRPRVV